jgi:hypothetical protein
VSVTHQLNICIADHVLIAIAHHPTAPLQVYTLSAWYADVLKRYDQLAAWTAGDIVTPVSVWLPGLFNPKAFLTAVMQTYARSNKLPLDVMRFMTEGESRGSGVDWAAERGGC